MTTLRPFSFSDNDYQLYVELANAAHPEEPISEKQARAFESHVPGEHNGLWVVGSEDKLVAAGWYMVPPRYSPVPGTARVTVFTQLETKQDVLLELYRHLEAELLKHQPKVLLTLACEDWRELDFYQSQGFSEYERFWESVLELATFNPEPFEPYLERVHSQGIEIRSLSELPNDESFQRRVYELITTLKWDIPRSGPYQPRSFEEWQKQRWHNPASLREGTFLAIKDEQLLGITQLSRTNDAEVLQTGLTGVLAAWRRRGTAQALKLCATRFAVENGFRFVRTGNLTNNRPILALNEAMGFVKEPVWFKLQKEVEKSKLTL
jgi:RimJ/RimL family protein N-acetyltransferase